MLRSDHRIMISQDVHGEDHWTTIRLADKIETKDGTSITGTWKPSADSYNNAEIKFTSDNPQYLYWEWSGGPHGGDLSIGSKMGRASYKEGEDTYFQVLITLRFIKRQANGTWKVGSVLPDGAGELTYRVDPDFEKGAITWEVVRYER